MDDLNLSDSGDDEMKDDMKQVDHESAIAEDEMYHSIIKHEFEQFWSSDGECHIFYNLYGRNLIQTMIESDVQKQVSIEISKNIIGRKYTILMEILIRKFILMKLIEDHINAMIQDVYLM